MGERGKTINDCFSEASNAERERAAQGYALHGRRPLRRKGEQLKQGKMKRGCAAPPVLSVYTQEDKGKYH